MMPGTPYSKTKAACDQCRFRKLRCDGGDPCARCSKMEFECSFTRTTRNRRVEQLRRQQRHFTPVAERSPEHDNDDDQTSTPLNGGEPEPRQSTTSEETDGAAYPPEVADNHESIPLNWPTAAHEFLPSNLPEPSAEAGPSGTVAHDRHRPGVASVGRIALPSGVSTWHETHDHLPANGPASNTAAPRPQDTPLPHDTLTSQTGSWTPSSFTSTGGHENGSALGQNNVLTWLNIFFDRLSSTLPIVNHMDVYQDVMRNRQEEDPNFASMVLSLCALALVQPVFRLEASSMPARAALARNMLRSALKARDFNFGENMTVEAVVASFFMFAALHGLDQPKAAWLRLREAVESGILIGLHRPETYKSLSLDEQSHRFRLFLILAVTERGYALQRNHYISFLGQHLEKMDGVYKTISASFTTQVSDILIHDGRNFTAMQGLLQLMRLFDSVDEDVIPCWNRSCSPPLTSCNKLTLDRVHRVYDAIANAMKPDSRLRQDEGILHRPLTMHSTIPGRPATELNDIQWADCYMLQQWLLIRMWVSCLTHDLLAEESELGFMRPSFALVVADNVLDQCQKLDPSVLEVHGLGMIERLHDIALGVVMAIQHYSDDVGVAVVDQGHASLERYFELLQVLRNGDHSFTSSLREACKSTVA